MARPDDSRLRDHARAHGLTFRWRTRREGAHWHADVRIWKDGEQLAWFGTSTMAGEQAALDGAIDLCIAPPDQPVMRSVNLGDARWEGKPSE